MFGRIRLVCNSQKSTNGRVFLVSCVLAAGLVVATLPESRAGSTSIEGPYRHTIQAMAVGSDLQSLVDEVMIDGGSDVKRFRELHKGLLAAYREEPKDGPEFAFRLVGLARAAGIVGFFAAVDLPRHATLRGEQLAAGVYRHDSIVVFEGAEVRRLPLSRVRPIGDRAATAVLLAGAGRELLRAGDTQAAIDRLETSVGLDPQLAYAWHDLGVALRREGEPERALDAYEHSLELVAVGTGQP